MASPKASNKELEYWRGFAEDKEKQFVSLDKEYRDFQKSSHEFENELEEELAQSQMECDRLKARLSKTDATLRKTREENDRLRQQSDEEALSLQKQLDGAKEGTEAASIAQKLHHIIREKQHLEAKAADDVSELREELERSLERIEFLETELEEMSDQHDLDMDDLRAELRDAKLLAAAAGAGGGGGGGDGGGGGGAQFMEIIDSLKMEVQLREEKIELLAFDKDQLEARLLEESELNEELTGEVSDLTDDFMANSDKIEDLEQRLKEAEDRAAELELEGVAAQAAVASAAKSSSSSKRGGSGSGSGDAVDDAKLRAKLTQSEKRTADMVSTIDSLEAQLKMAQTVNEQVTAESSSLGDKNVALSKSIADLNDCIDEWKEKVATASAQIEELGDTIKVAEQRAADAEKRMADADGRVNEVESTLRTQATSGQSNLLEVQRRCDILQSHVTKLEVSEADLTKVLEEERSYRTQMEAKEERERALKIKLRHEKAEVKNDTLMAMAKVGGAMGGAVAHTTNALGGVRSCMNGLAEQMDENSSYIVRGFESLKHSFGKLGVLIKSTEDNYKSELKKRMALFDDLQDVKGNIKVYCRVRPFLPSDGKVQDVVEYPGHAQVALTDGDRGTNSFTFDRVYPAIIDQSEIFTDVRSLVESVLDGYPVCIFAYGQTGSGKTYTMEGPPDNRGISFRSLDAIFNKIRALAPQWTYKVSVSLMEVYNERLRDLLDSDAVVSMDMEDDSTAEQNDGKLQIRKGPHGHYVTNLRKYVVKSADEVLEVMALGNKNRSVGTTNANEHSSRSHSILSVTVEGVDQVTQNRVHGRLSLVDLAGSERIKNTESTGQRLVEATYINKSLSALGDVMTALSNPKKGQHVPFRNSKLTHLLQDSLGGNSKTMMFVNMNASDKAAQETLCSLQFAGRVRKVRLSANAQVENSALNTYRDKVEQLKGERKNLQTMLDNQKQRSLDKLAEKENQVKELNHTIKRFNQTMTDFEMQKKKEIADVQAQFSKMQRSATSSQAKSAEDKLQRKIDSTTERLEQAQKLLKLTQRENKALKESVSKSTDAVKDKYKEQKVRAKALEQKLEKMQQEKSGARVVDQQSLEEWKKKAEAHEQLVKALRDKNKKLSHELQAAKTNDKREKVKKFKEARSRMVATHRFATDTEASKRRRSVTSAKKKPSSAAADGAASPKTRRSKG